MLRRHSPEREHHSGLTKAARKDYNPPQRRDLLARIPDNMIVGDLDDIEEGEFLLDEKEGEVEVSEQSVCFFKVEDYQYLLSKTMFSNFLNGNSGINGPIFFSCIC